MDTYINIQPADWSSVSDTSLDASADMSTEASSLTIHEESSVSYEYDGMNNDENGAAHACGFDDDDVEVCASDPMLDAAFAAAFEDNASADVDVSLCHGLPGGYTIICDDACRHLNVGDCAICKCDALVGLQTDDMIVSPSYKYTCARGHNVWLGPTGRDCIACMHEDVYAASSIAVRCECPREGDPVRVSCGHCGIVQYQHAWTDDECALLCTHAITCDCTHAHRLSNEVLDTRAWVRSICEFLYEARFDDMCPIQNTAYSATLQVLVTCTDDEASQSQRPIHYARTHGWQHVHVQWAPSRTDLIINIIQAFNRLGNAFARPTQFDAVIADYNIRAGICDHVEPFELSDVASHTTSRLRTPPKTMRRCKEFNIHGEIAHLRKDISMSLPKFTKRDVANALPQSSKLTKPRKVSSAALIKL